MGAFPRVKPVGDRAVVLQIGDTLDATTVSRVRALDARVRNSDIRGVVEIVPTYASLLAVYEKKEISFPQIASQLLDLAQDLDATESVGRLVEIDAVYDGEDLPDVAGRAGLSQDEVIRVHSGCEYRALMLGFSPGFAYQGFVDERLHLPRRKTPRTRVPAGSIGIAGPQTGIYPRVLPGGWNLLARTSVRLFDPFSPQPSTLMPGDRVRFRPVASLEAAPPSAEIEYAGTGVEVVEPGLLTTVQDEGRRGLRHVAVPWAGFADPSSAHLANSCVGNPPGSAVIEICGPGLTLRFEQPAFLAVCGARVEAELERADLADGRQTLPMNVAVRVRPSNVITVTNLAEGARAYVAISGLTAPALLGSAATDVAGGLLRALRAGDRLKIGTFDADRVLRDPVRSRESTREIRVVLGPQDDFFSRDEIRRFLETDWMSGIDSDRVGTRLDGARIAHQAASEIVSDAMIPGCIQVPPDGRPIAMLADCPTTGGYPKIACVISEDLGALAQAVPGRTVFRFTAVNPETF